MTQLDVSEDSGIISLKVNQACQFVFRNLEKKKYNLKLLEKQGKVSVTPKLLQELVIDLSDERDIMNGLKIVKLEINSTKRLNSEALNFSIFSAIFLCFSVLSLVRFDLAKQLVNNFIVTPFILIQNTFFSKKKLR